MKNDKEISKMAYSWLEIDLAALESNYRLIKSRLARRAKVLAVVKADAYGHGLIPISRRLARLGVGYLAVTSIAEALSLRKARITKPILLLNAVLPGQVEFLFKYDITATVSSFNQAATLSAQARKYHRSLKVHIEIDTGMGRYGLWYKDAVSEVKKIVRLPGLKLEGIFTHFPCADTDLSFTKKQLKLFKDFLKILRQDKIIFKFTHIANSAGIINCYDSSFTLVRPGLMLYGLSWDKELTKSLGLKPVMNFKTRILFLKTVGQGRSISYGRTYIAKAKRVIATLGVGYADGYNRLLSNKAQVLIRGASLPVVGIVCMDNIMVDATKLKAARLGDEVVLFGQQGRRRIYVEELAKICQSIPYEIVCNAAKCVNRVYVG